MAAEKEDDMLTIMEELITRYPQLGVCRGEVEEACRALIRCFSTGHKLLVCGNGGSCADAEHIVGELMKGFLKKRRFQMIYTVGEMAQKLGVPASTLRYYDKEGLLPFVERSSGGIRMFRENDFEWLQVIRCMKQAGMSIKDIRQYIELSMQGDDTIDTRLEMFRHQREVLTQQIQQLQHTLETVEYKCWFYEAAKAAGTVDVPGAMTDADVPEQFRAIRQELRGQKMPNGEK